MLKLNETRVQKKILKDLENGFLDDDDEEEEDGSQSDISLHDEDEKKSKKSDSDDDIEIISNGIKNDLNQNNSK